MDRRCGCSRTARCRRARSRSDRRTAIRWRSGRVWRAAKAWWSIRRPVSRTARACAPSAHEEVVSMAAIEIRNVHKEYQRDSQRIPVLSGLSLSVDEGDYVALMGPSGSGKTTLLNLVGGLDQPTRGQG